MADEVATYNKQELRSVLTAFKSMDAGASEQAKGVSNGLATYLQSKIIAAASNTGNKIDDRIAQNSRVSKSSKIGEISFGFVSQKYSGGATTQQLWGGAEFGSNKYKQFPNWSGKYRRGSRGWFIYPTLRTEQPRIIAQWETAVNKILKEW